MGNRLGSGSWRALSLVAVGALALSVAREVRGDLGPLTWQATTTSPRPAGVDAQSASLQALCGVPDAALAEVAGRAASRQAQGAGLAGADELTFDLRAAGDPHAWPRAWSIAGPSLEEDDLAKRVRAWLAPWNTLGVRRCGVARAEANGTKVVTIMAIDALADLSPLPTTARVGQWLSLDATMLVPATAAKVVLLGPRGAPKTVPVSLTGDRIHSTFSVDQPGPWVIQVLATLSVGPRPVLEASVYAGVAPPTQFVPSPAPGESAAAGAADDDDAMLRMINAARASEALPPLARDATLDKLARVHSEEMLKARLVAHDVGTGDPAARMRAAGVSAHVAGENVAAASTVENAHRTLWASPSHRGNLLLEQYSHVGVAVVRAPDGTVWVTEMFSG